ncbi:MAG: cytidyltransferase [Methanobacteriaceae archaeon]|nr:cytidyltransferase [Methanobacteriaceae archaeon]
MENNKIVGISADFDPVHLGHEALIKKALEIAKDEKEVVVYLNKGTSANHAPFFTNFEARKEMALKLGANRVVGVDGLHHRLNLSYSVPIRMAMMIEDGLTDYVSAANVSSKKIIDYGKEFARKEIFSGIPRNLPNRNVIRWFAVNEFLYKKYNKKVEFHMIPEVEVDGEKISGRVIRKEILDNDLEIPDHIKKLLPSSTVKILKKHISYGNIPEKRDLKEIKWHANKDSLTNLLDTAYINVKAAEKIMDKRSYNFADQIWGSLRMADYGPVLTRLAISCIEKGVTKKEVYDLLLDYEKDGIIPPDQTISKIIDRAWFVAVETSYGIPAQVANKNFFSRKNISIKRPVTVEGGMYLKSNELKYLKEDVKVGLYVDNKQRIACRMKINKYKIKTPLVLEGHVATYIRLLMDSQFIPLYAKLVHKKKGWRIRISVGS